MKLRLVEIPEEGLKIQEERSSEWLLRSTGLDEGEPFRLDGPIRISLHARKIKRQVTVRGQVSADVVFQCSRCLKPGRQTVTGEIEETFLPADKFGTSAGKRVDLQEEDFAYALYENDEIDLGRYIADTLLLVMPMFPHCADSQSCAAGDVAFQEDWEEGDMSPPVNPAWKEGLARAKKNLMRTKRQRRTKQ